MVESSLVLHLNPKTAREFVTAREVAYLERLDEDPLSLPIGPGYPERPKTRAECRGGHRPCPFVSCSHHLYLDVMPGGNVRVNHPSIEVASMKESCALDLAEAGPNILDDVGRALNLTREGARKVEEAATKHVLRQRKNGSSLACSVDEKFEHAPGFTTPDSPEE